MDYINRMRLIRNALTNKAYLPTYAAFGGAAMLLTVYIFEWEEVGRKIPIWKYHFTSKQVENG